MGKMMEYKGYHATIEFDSEDYIFVGKVHGIVDSLNFHGTTVEQLEEMFHQSVDNYLEMCESVGKIPDKEYSGMFNVRISAELHKKVYEAALTNDTTINAIVKVALEKHLNEQVKETVVYVPYSVPSVDTASSKYMKQTTSMMKEVTLSCQ